MGARSVFAWFVERAEPKPWLVAGKGPSFGRGFGRLALESARMNVLALNHAMNFVETTLGHVTDLDVLPDITREPQFLVMPWHPHVGNKPGRATLDELIPSTPLLARLAYEGRVLWYNSSLCPKALRRKGPPVVRVRYFSAVAAINLLGAAGIKKVSTVGIDGGTKYAEQFDPKTLLSNGRKSFDVQFQEIELAERVHGMKVTPFFDGDK